MDAKKCDRCGEFYLMEDLPKLRLLVSTVYKPTSSKIGTKDWDLCPRCTEHIFNFLTLSEEEKENGE